MRRFSCGPKSFSHNFLNVQHLLSVEKQVCGNVASKAFRPIVYSRAFYNIGCAGNCINSATLRMQLLKRYIHATEFRNSSEGDHYQILGVSYNASNDDIKKAFHLMAKKYHPDANENKTLAKIKFQQIRESYEILQDSERRAEYDKRQVKHASRHTENTNCTSSRDNGGFEHEIHVSWDTEYSSFQDVFSAIKRETEACQAVLSISFMEAACGCSKDISFSAKSRCDSCDGHGCAWEICTNCKGATKMKSDFGSRCSTCKGLGYINKEKSSCRTCGGSGRVKVLKEVTVTIPAGIDTGDVISIPRAGSVGIRGKPRTLKLKLKVAEDTVFKREGSNLYVDSKISYSQAIMGGKVEVPTLSGNTEVEIPKGVKPGQVSILRGRGLPKKCFSVLHGDQYVRFCYDYTRTREHRYF